MIFQTIAFPFSPLPLLLNFNFLGRYFSTTPFIIDQALWCLCLSIAHQPWTNPADAQVTEDHQGKCHHRADFQRDIYQPQTQALRTSPPQSNSQPFILQNNTFRPLLFSSNFQALLPCSLLFPALSRQAMDFLRSSVMPCHPSYLTLSNL